MLTVDRVRPLLAFAFVTCLCAGVLAMGMNRAPAHRTVTETRQPAAASQPDSTLVLGDTLQGRSRVLVTTPGATRTPTTAAAPFLRTPAAPIQVSAPQLVSRQTTGTHRASAGAGTTTTRHATHTVAPAPGGSGGHRAHPVKSHPRKKKPASLRPQNKLATDLAPVLAHGHGTQHPRRAGKAAHALRAHSGH